MDIWKSANQVAHAVGFNGMRVYIAPSFSSDAVLINFLFE